ncbi:MAG: hypothetical protein PWQ97_1308 [Tepidanaerobacteraceae bacterium]|nr:hypothetical protein [Tepidanaerobacteraceae bacterium]
MIAAIDVSAAIEVVMGRPKQKKIINILEKAEWVIAPSLYIYEASNVMWKYHLIQNYPVDELLHKIRHLIEMVDQFIKAEDLYEEAIPLACKLKHPAYDVMYLVVSRRKNATLVTLDSKLIDAAKMLDIPVAAID